MNTHSGHYVKGSGRGSLPGRFVSIVVTTDSADRTSRIAGASPGRFRSAALAVCHRSGSGYSRPWTAVLGSPSAVWEWLESPRLTGRLSWVVSPVASDSLTLLQFWARLESEGCRWAGGRAARPLRPDAPRPTTQYSISRMVLAGSPDVISYRKGDRRYKWVSGRNYYKMSQQEIARACGYQWTTLAESDDSADCQSASPCDRALMWLHAITSLAVWWSDRRAGAFPTTIASMGYSFLRSRIPAKSVVTHKNDDVLLLERKCCHGGRATAFFSGDIRPQGRHTPPHELAYPSSGSGIIAGPIHHVDVRSMYPSIMVAEDFPVRFSHAISAPTVEHLSELVKAYHVIARVGLETEIAEYPHRTGERIIYPVGRYVSHLTTPEICAALADGAIRHVHEVACYYRGRPFTAAAAELLALRAEAESLGRADWAMTVKAMTNASTGKLAQRRGMWSPDKITSPLMDWGEWRAVDAQTGVTSRYRALAGLVSRYEFGERGTGTLTAAYAVLTGYGRIMMRRLRELIHHRAVLSQDTDGMWVTDWGLAELRRSGAVWQSTQGKLQLKQSVASARFWDSKHYFAGCSWILAGVSDPAFVHGSSVYASHETLNPIRRAPLDAPDTVIEISRSGSVSCIPEDGHRDIDGWIVPYRLPGGIGGKGHPPPPLPDSLFPPGS